MTDIRIILDSKEADSQRRKKFEPGEDGRNCPEASERIVGGSVTIVIDEEVELRSDTTVRSRSTETGQHRSGDAESPVIRLCIGQDTEPAESDHDIPWRVDGFVG
jgi:hypothetical protein